MITSKNQLDFSQELKYDRQGIGLDYDSDDDDDAYCHI
jgi:hypothetical protein